jgi:hypothetical protein
MLLLIAAYELGDAETAALREEMQRRLVEQVPVERSYQQEKLDHVRAAREGAGQSKVGGEERREFAKRMLARLDQMPLAEKRVAEWLEHRLPPDRASKGRRRLEELWQRREQKRSAWLSDDNQRAGAKTRSIETCQAEVASVTKEGNPLPAGLKHAMVVAAETSKTHLVQPVEPSRGVGPPSGPAKASPRVDTSQARTGRGGDERTAGSKAGGQASSPPSSRPAAADEGKVGANHQTKMTAPARPLDEWDRQVAEAAKKCAFTDGQVARARAMLADLKGRVEQYREARAEAFAQAEQIADAAARAEQMRLLDSPIGAMFEELKSRLESLPTPEQRQRAEAAMKAKG